MSLLQWEVRYSIGGYSSMIEKIIVVASLASVKTLLVKLSENESNAIAFLEKNGDTLYTLSYWNCNQSFHARRFIDTVVFNHTMREFSRDRAKSEHERKQERKRIGAEKFANMRK